jgi:hypothetical protein
MKALLKSTTVSTLERAGACADPVTAKAELAKFFAIAKDMLEAPGMFSKYIDGIWHNLLESPEYSEFSIAACGEIVEHVPISGEGRVEWVDAYHAKYGENLPKEWFCDAEGMLDEAAYAEYLATEIVNGGWNCNPKSGGRKPNDCKK